MIKTALRGLARRFPKAARWAVYAKFNARDIYDTYLAPSLAPSPTPFGFQFGGLASAAHAAMQKGTFEPDEIRLFQSLLPHADVFLDIGANVGYFTCHARYAGTPAVAFEPMPRNLAALYLNLEVNGWSDTEVLPLGLSDRPGVVTLYGASGTGASLIDNWAGAPSSFKRSICVSTLDTLMASRFADQQVLIKMDVEGHEYPVLLGAQSIMRRERGPVWLIEITFHEFHPSGHNPTFGDAFMLFFSAGYRAFLVAPAKLVEIHAADVMRWVANGKTDGPEINYLFVPATRVRDFLGMA